MTPTQLTQVREALELGCEAAYQLAQEYHVAMRGYRPEQHEAADAAVANIEAALAIVRSQEAAVSTPAPPEREAWIKEAERLADEYHHAGISLAQAWNGRGTTGSAVAARDASRTALLSHLRALPQAGGGGNEGHLRPSLASTVPGEPFRYSVLTDHAGIEQAQWTDKDGALHTMPVWRAIRLVRDLYDEWPGGLEEVEASVNGMREALHSVAGVLPGTTYMDPPDGGAPTILEQLQRQAKDAARWCWWKARPLMRLNTWAGKWRVSTPDAVLTDWLPSAEAAVDAARERSGPKLPPDEKAVPLHPVESPTPTDEGGE